MQKQNISFDCSVPLRSIQIFFKYHSTKKDQRPFDQCSHDCFATKSSHVYKRNGHNPVSDLVWSHCPQTCCKAMLYNIQSSNIIWNHMRYIQKRKSWMVLFPEMISQVQLRRYIQTVFMQERSRTRKPYTSANSDFTITSLEIQYFFSEVFA